MTKKLTNMKGLSVAVMLAVSLVILCAIEFTCGYKPGREWRRNFKNVDSILGRHQDRFRRQLSPNCTRALEEFQSEHFQDCFNTLDKVSDNDLTNDDLKVYCDNDCSSEIIRVTRALARYCDNGGGVSDIYCLHHCY